MVLDNVDDSAGEDSRLACEGRPEGGRSEVSFELGSRAFSSRSVWQQTDLNLGQRGSEVVWKDLRSQLRREEVRRGEKRAKGGKGKEGREVD